MIIYLCSTQPEINIILSRELEKAGHMCYTFNTKKMFAYAMTTAKVYPDLLVLDFLLINHEILDIYKMINDQKVYLPLIFYNDPCLTNPSRTEHWINENYILLNEKNKNEDTYDENRYREVYKLIENTITADSIKPYIALMQDPKPFPDELKIDKIFDNISNVKISSTELNNLIADIQLPKNLIKLLQILYDNPHIYLSREDLLNQYSRKTLKVSQSTLNVLISNLRKYLAKTEKYKFKILVEEAGYKLQIE